MLKKILLVLLVFVSCVSFASETITVRADVWMPYNGEPDADKPGYGIEIMKAVFEPKNIKIDYQTMPWNRAVDDTKEGKFDSIIGAGVRDAEGCIFPTETIGYNINDLFVKPDSTFKFERIEGLNSVKIGIIADYSYSEAFDAYVAANKDDEQKIFVVSGDGALEKLYKMVLAGRIDAFMENPLVVAQESWKDEVKSAGQVGDKDALYVAFSPAKESSKKYAEMFDAGIKELRANGKLKAILDSYGLTDWAN